MDVADAVRIAKEYLRRVYADEEIRNLGLEEVEIDDKTNEWLITLGFSRKWDYRQSSSPFTDMYKSPELNRSYKTVRLKADSGDVTSVKDRILEAR